MLKVARNSHTTTPLLKESTLIKERERLLTRFSQCLLTVQEKRIEFTMLVLNGKSKFYIQHEEVLVEHLSGFFAL